ncbi:GTP 3',8-cyclase MoaA [Ectothiorhodospira marina]|uniref:GTP 3',8-cyclase n=1 Tax=Ectothiorhodospira marina TaxID=1396821 RepID=A0A1H7LZ16_9GAMM|nr:GTP 3',8-cyclase MoaA [Ectothiorhodospira marina]SEL03715.1 cyclic pyranopterin phosphate synthase [Ectothiorhodospira marina]
MSPTPSPPLVDRFGRRVSYLRISITDRCDFRCVYCMSEDMQFLPRSQVLTLEEIQQIARAFVALGVDKIRITGGEPLVRRGVTGLFRGLGTLPGLEELTLTTNGSQLARHAPALRAAGVRRINISLDSLRPERFRHITRQGELQRVLDGIDAALAAGMERVKINSVILKGRNADEIIDLVEFCRARDMDISFIEEMPLGVNADHDRAEVFYSSDQVRADIQARYRLIPTTESTGGPSRYFRLDDGPTRIGFISPHSHNFCVDCNRVRLTAEGRLLLCLGQEHSVDLRQVVREYPGDSRALTRAIVEAMQIKPQGHTFDLSAKPVILRHMSVTGG